MFFKKITLQDFKCYEGAHSLAFAPAQSDKNLFLLGGKNGAGKTSFLKAIAMCLYGGEGAFTRHVLRHPADPDAPVSKRKEAVRDELRSILNKAALRQGRLQAKVTLTFLAPEAAVEVSRAWNFNATGDLLDEHLDITRDGSPLKEDEDPLTGEIYSVGDDLTRVMETLFPPNIAKFFLFDGEDIQRLAQEEPESEIVEGVDLLLGFDVLKRLESDLGDTTDRYRQQIEKSQENEIRALEHLREVKQLEVDRMKAGRQRDELTALLDENREELDSLVRKLHPFISEGRSGTSDLQADLDRTVDRTRSLDDRIRENLEGVIVPSLPRVLAKQLLARLNGEAKYATWVEGKNKVEPQLDKLCEEVLGPNAEKPVPPLKQPQQEFLVALLRRKWNDLFHPPPADVAADPRHDRLAAAELDLVRAKLQDVVSGAAVDLGVLLDERETLSRRSVDLEGRLSSSASNDELASMIARRDDVNRRIGELQAQYDAALRQIESVDIELQEKRRQHAYVTREGYGDPGVASEKAKFCRDIQEIVRKFQERRRPQKIREVKEHLVDMFRRLARKEDVIQDIEIEERGYHIRLLDRRRQSVPMRDLSAGEKEIFAISLLWALGKASGRELPVVIDTPLARLDRDHRQNIVNRYLPRAGKQVLILSTDTELDTQYVTEIQSHIADKYHLVFDVKDEKTRIERGYF